MTVGGVATIANLPAAAMSTWTRWLSPAQSQSLAAVTGVPPESLEAMTLSRYDGAALRLDPESHRLDPKFPFGPLSRSRFCPACIRETDGRWQLRWRLGWSFACPRHDCLLVDFCTKCGKHQRLTQPYRRRPTPTTCRCGQPLGAVPTMRWPNDHAFSWAQRTIDTFIDSGANTFGVFREHPGQLPEALDAVRSLTNRVLTSASVRPLRVKGLEGDSTAEVEVEYVSATARGTLNAKAPQSAIDMAVGVTVALSVLRNATVSECGRAAQWFVEGQNACAASGEIGSCARDSTVAAAIVLKARSDSMGPELQLRYRTATAMPCAPASGRKRIQKKAAHLPAAIWPEWASCLLTGRRKTVVLREALSCATLLVGAANLKVAEVLQLLGVAVRPSLLTQQLSALSVTGSWKPVSLALVELSDFLEQAGGQINYDRRRRLDYSMLLDNDAPLQRLAEGAYLPLLVNSPPMVNSLVATRCYLIERISGSPNLALSDYPEMDERELNTLVTAFRAGLAGTAVTALDQVAREFLAQQDVAEPVHWHPPLKLLKRLNFQ